MTSDDYAHIVAERVAAVVSNMDDSWKRPAVTLQRMLRERITGLGVEYEVAPNVQAVEVKPVADLLADIRQEATDQVAYTVALRERFPEVSADADNLIALSVQAMGCVERMAADLERVA